MEYPEIIELDIKTTEEGYIKITNGWGEIDKPSVLIHPIQIPILINFLSVLKEN